MTDFNWKEFLDFYEQMSRVDREFLVKALTRFNRNRDAGFYDSEEWRRVRYRVLKKTAGCCQCCGQRPSPGNPLHVDHIKPRSLFPGLALSTTNLQVLCAACNT